MVLPELLTVLAAVSFLQGISIKHHIKKIIKYTVLYINTEAYVQSPTMMKGSALLWSGWLSGAREKNTLSQLETIQSAAKGSIA